VSRLNPDKLHARFLPGAEPEGPPAPRCYTLTHSDATGDLFLTVGPVYDRKQVSGWYTRLMRDEVLAQWQLEEARPALHVYCHVSGGLALGPAGWRDGIFRHELPRVLEAFRAGDATLFEAYPDLDQVPIVVHFRSHRRRYRRREVWGTLADYRLAT
jgi:magnesium dechelatase